MWPLPLTQDTNRSSVSHWQHLCLFKVSHSKVKQPLRAWKQFSNKVHLWPWPLTNMNQKQKCISLGHGQHLCSFRSKYFWVKACKWFFKPNSPVTLTHVINKQYGTSEDYGQHLCKVSNSQITQLRSSCTDIKYLDGQTNRHSETSLSPLYFKYETWKDFW